MADPIDLDQPGDLGNGPNLETYPRDVVRLHKCYRTVHEMVRDRGFVVDDAEINISLRDFVEAHIPDPDSPDPNRLNFTVATGSGARSLLVWWTDEENVGVKPIRKLVEKITSGDTREAIIIYKKSITSSAVKVMASLDKTYQIEQFQEAELLVNITKHELVPAHVVLTPAEKKVLLERYRLKESQLPRIQLQDPVARYYGLKRGQIVKIIRNSETAGRYVTYRACS